MNTDPDQLYTGPSDAEQPKTQTPKENPVSTDQLYAIATGPSKVDWRDAFARRHEQAVIELATEQGINAILRAHITELEAAQGDLTAAATATAKRLYDLTGSAVCVDLNTIHRDAISGPDAVVSWKCYSSRMHASAAGDTLAEAEAGLRAKWAEFARPMDDDDPVLRDIRELNAAGITGPMPRVADPTTDDFPY